MRTQSTMEEKLAANHAIDAELIGESSIHLIRKMAPSFPTKDPTPKSLHAPAPSSESLGSTRR